MLKSITVNLLVMGFFLLLVDGCVYRDPHVKLTGGYVISAVSHGSPCEIYLDTIPDATWSAMPSIAENEILLFNRNDDSTITVSSLAEIQTRFGPETVDLSEIAPRIDDVTGYTFNTQFVAGKSANSYFLLAVDAHNYESWNAREDWAQAVTDTGLSPSRLSDPKAWIRQWRHPATFPVYATMLLMAAVTPMLWCRREPNGGDRTKP